MITHCPRCGIRYAWLECLAGPSSCKECHERHELPSVDEAFRDDPAISNTDVGAELRIVDPDTKLSRIAGRNFIAGLTLFTLGLALPVATLAVSVRRGSGSFVFIG